MVGAAGRAAALADQLAARLDELRARTSRQPRPLVYFEEWDGPLITGIGWVSELIEIAGGRDCFAELVGQSSARERIVTPELVLERRPEIIVGSWCGKRFRPERVAARPGLHDVPAVAAGRVYELKSSLILQPGPAALTDGLDALAKIIGRWAEEQRQ
jgi:iron complex transport system substrate-binding protein